MSASLNTSTCGAQQAVTSVGTDTAIAYGGLTYNTTGPLGGNAISFDGTSGHFNTLNSYNGLNRFTELAWFKTTASGSIFDFSNIYGTTGVGSWDRMIWLDSTGHVVAGVYPNAVKEVKSPSTYNDGAWHLVAVTLNSSGGNKGFRLYIDGALKASNTGVTTAQAYTGYYHIGWSNAITGWTDPPTNAYFNGSLAGVGVIPTALTAAQISSLYTSANMSAYSSTIVGDTPTAYWELNDTGTTPYTGPITGITATTPTLADASGNGNTGTIEGTVTLGATGPTSLGGNAISLPGTSGSLVNTTNSYADPNNSNGTLSQSIWFNTTSSGALMGFTAQQTDTPTPGTYDRMFWIDSTGHLVYSIYSPDVAGSFAEVTSTGTYNNGAWHLAVATVGPAGEILYVDGVQVAINTVAQNAQVFTGYWHIGYAYTSGWTNPPSSNYFNGSLAHAAIYPTPLTATQVSTLYNATSAANEESDILALSPTSYWPLTDTVASDACALAQVTVQAVKGATTTCVVPTGVGVCPAPSSTVTAGTIGTAVMPTPTTSNNVTLTTSMDVAPGLPTNATNLRLLVPFNYSANVSTFGAQLNYSSSVVIL